MSGLSANSQQEAAVRALHGPVLIQAGAGTGKTRTLTNRFVRALDGLESEGWQGAGVGDILTITFTEKAAGELSERIRTALRAEGRTEEALSVDGAWISTIHGLCTRVLRRYALEAGLDPEFAIIDPIDDQRLKERTFERAAAIALKSPEGARLFAAYVFADIFGAVERIAGVIRARGLSIADITTGEAPDALELHRAAHAFFAQAADRLTGCGAAGKNAQTLRERCTGVAARLGQCDLEEVPPEDVADLVLQELSAWTAGGRAAGEAEPIRQELKEHHAALLERAAACVCAPLEQAIVGLVELYTTAYAGGKRRMSCLDFDDLQVETARLLTRRPDIAAELRDRLKLVMVDEFQDTDSLQLRLIEALAGEDLCTVGDEYQSIYRFRGADIEVYRAHNGAALARGARTFELSTNYRSHEAVLAFVNRVFASEVFSGGGLIRLQAGRDSEQGLRIPADEPRIDMVLVDSTDCDTESARSAEAAAVARRFAALRDEHRVDPGGMVVLMRQLTHAQEYATALRREGFDVALSSGGGLLGRPEVMHVRALVRVIANPLDESALAHVMGCMAGQISDDGLWALRQDARQNRDGLWQALGRMAGGLLAEPDTAYAVRLVDAIRAARSGIGRDPLGDVILRAVEETEFDLALLAAPEHGVLSLANVVKIADMAREYEASGGMGPRGFALYLDDRERFREHTSPATVVSTDSRTVRIMSVHASKGLEFPVVAVVEGGAARPAPRDIVRWGVEDGRLRFALRVPPSASSDAKSSEFTRLHAEESRADDEESKRLFYVACTRARDVLIVSGASALAKEGGTAGPTQIIRMRMALAGSVAWPEPGAGPSTCRMDGHAVRAEVIAAGEAAGAAESPSGGEGDIEPTARREGASARRAASSGEAHPEAGTSRRMTVRGPERLSYSDLALFDTCELRFHLERVLRIGRAPSAVGGPVSFGSATHAALQLASAGRAPAAERLAAISRRFLLDAPLQEEMEAVVDRFVSSELAHRMDANESVHREWAFTLRLGPKDAPLDLVGSIDAYGRTGTSGLVVDYKSGSAGEHEELVARYRTQAQCYALVALSDGCTEVDVVFCRPQVVDEHGSMQEIAYRFAAADAAVIEQEILARRDRMGASRRRPRDRWEARECGGCSASGTLCPRVGPSEGSGA